ncbi:dockerin type I domain-containing protein [Mucisphaera calidilacus]|uniref:Dockerin domain-containing protein n=1 Tax=Mucisphaera calidilacus TaxID=2527982 RepID=A0A518BWZ6_9BACT|nr:dockerin type I domain-containing protein [Mucisphaera calidilacus]QDU71503.1 hypothetical protein Pan265_13530 [Mucisphaera calidilacus]
MSRFTTASLVAGALLASTQTASAVIDFSFALDADPTTTDALVLVEGGVTLTIAAFDEDDEGNDVPEVISSANGSVADKPWDATGIGVSGKGTGSTAGAPADRQIAGYEELRLTFDQDVLLKFVDYRFVGSGLDGAAFRVGDIETYVNSGAAIEYYDNGVRIDPAPEGYSYVGNLDPDGINVGANDNASVDEFTVGDLLIPTGTELIFFDWYPNDYRAYYVEGIQVEIAPVTSVPGDANGDGLVDLLDLSILASNFEGTETPYTVAEGDFNEDGFVDLLDLSILASNFDSGAAAPEPAALSLLGLGVLVAGRRMA